MAASQSKVQSLLQNLTGLQTNAQSWVPNSGVSGNPNTAYNNAPPKSTNDPAQPTSGFQGQPINWQQLSAQADQNAVPGGFKGFPDILKGAGVGWKPDAVGIGTPPPGTGPLNNGGGSGAGAPGTGGNLPPQQNNGQYGVKFQGPNDPILSKFDLHNGGGYNLFNLPDGFVNGLYSPNQTTGSYSSKDFMSAFKGLGNTSVNLGSVGKTLGNTALGRAVGITPDGTVDVAQILDLFIPGNVYMGQTHQTNFANAIPALAGMINPLLGMAVSKVMDYFGAKYASEDDSKLGTGIMGSIRRMLRNRYMKNQANRAAGHGNGAGAGAGAGGGGYGTGGGSSPGGFSGGGWLGGGMPNMGSGGGTWVDSNGNPIDPSTFGGYWVDPTDPNSGFGGNNPFGDGAEHPSNGNNVGNGQTGINSGGNHFSGALWGWGSGGSGPNYT